MIAVAPKGTLAGRMALGDDTTIPRLGVRVSPLKEKRRVHEVVLAALDTGYRFLATTAGGENLPAVGKAIRSSSVSRADLFVATTLCCDDGGYSHAIAALRTSLERLAIDAVDLVLIRRPRRGRIIETWDALVELREQQAVYALGVSDFSPADLRALKERTTVLPSVNQVEWNGYTYPRETIEYCQHNGIAIEADCPLAGGAVCGDRRVRAIAAVYGRTPAQVVVRWLLQHNAVVVAEPSDLKQIRATHALFDFSLSPTEMASLDTIAES